MYFETQFLKTFCRQGASFSYQGKNCQTWDLLFDFKQLDHWQLYWQRHTALKTMQHKLIFLILLDLFKLLLGASMPRSVFLSVSQSVWQSVCLSVCPSVRLSVCPSVRLSVTYHALAFALYWCLPKKTKVSQFILTSWFYL